MCPLSLDCPPFDLNSLLQRISDWLMHLWKHYVCSYDVYDVICMLAVSCVWTDQLDWCDKYHPYIAFSPPLSLFPSVWVCWRAQDSQRFMSVTLSKSDISLTTPRTGTHVHTHTQPVSHRHTLPLSSLSPSPLLSSSQTCQWRDPQQTKSQTAHWIDASKHGWGS